ncbi:RNA polymerase sigma factor [Dyadobacter fermentans]|uniref:RNA polymerase, sigma-24 subunit, ECF subfamily n=1 Tax=Dyadobacter fermentans (strain ATCC 700827 / DSM 18053 / CIP 107007 / KCTC 52180 / NS114) TaxID=471854 RepID=C6VZK9_DYAFD|nr:RNA polymerase sigma-70 factor [Dyadobacter fermentans]ACT93487.1 RNA polymerase, sigma-24 subunit, ECF subfamily [Dyadobacter fermentans DSM 18053]
MQEILTNDAELLQLLRLGDRAAFEEIYNRYRIRMYRAALSKVGTSENAMEIVQEIFLDLWLRRDQVVIEDLERYLFSATKYKVLDFYKKEFTRKQYAESVQVTGPGKSYDTDETIAYNELSRSIVACIEQLPEKTRVIFDLNRIQGKSADEISGVLGIPLRTVEYHITQSLKALRFSLRDYLLTLIVTLGPWW